MHVYLDESGDLGWVFTAPHREGGSSRYLCLCFLILPKALKKKPGAIIVDLYSKYKWAREKKCSSASEAQKIEFATKAAQLRREFPEVIIDCIVVKKENVRPHIRSDANKLYNYMCRLIIVDRMAGAPNFVFIPDKRSIKVECGNSLSDYLQTVLWFDCEATTILTNQPGESHRIYNLQFADWVAHCIWKHFEDGSSGAYQILKPAIHLRTLFF